MPRNHPFNAKVIITEFLTLAIWIFLLIQALLSVTLQERLINGGLLFLVIIFGILLIRSVLKEIEQHSEFETLTRQLETANLELKRLDERRVEFISLAAHQLRTPLTVIKGYASMLLERAFGIVGKKTNDTLEKVSLATNQLIKMVDDLLNLSQIEAGRIKYKLADTDLLALVKEITDEFAVPAKTKGIALSFNADVNSLPPLGADAEKLKEAITNIIDNALKYSFQGGEVKVSLDKTDGAVRLKIEDSGIGMTQKDLGRLFTKFARSEAAQKIDPNGLGLGLYFVKRVVEDHNGRVWAESEGTGKGSTFVVELPLPQT